MPDAAVAMFSDGVKINPLKLAANPPEMDFLNVYGRFFNTVDASNFDFFSELHAVIEREPVSFLDPAIGNATAPTLALRPRESSDYLFPDSGWWAPIPGGSYEWLRDGGDGGRNLDARTLFSTRPHSTPRP